MQCLVEQGQLMYDTAGATCSFDLVEGLPDWLPLIVALLETYGFLVWMPFYCRYAAGFFAECVEDSAHVCW